MNYGNLINRAYNLSWEHKTFWILGFLSASWGYLGSFDEKFSGIFDNDIWTGDFDFDPRILENISDYFTSGPGIVVAMALVGLFFIIGLVMFALYLISVAGLIEGVVRVENGDSHKLSELFKAGFRHLWKFLGLFVMTFIAGGLYFGLIVVALVLIFVGFGAYGLIFLILIIPLCFVGVFFLSSLYSLAQRDMVINGSSLSKSLGEAFILLKNNIGPNIIIFLMTTFLWLIIVLCGLILVLIFAIPTLIIGAWSTMYMIIALVLVLPILVLIAIVVEGFLGTFFSSLFTYFYLELQKKTDSDAQPGNPDPLPID